MEPTRPSLLARAADGLTLLRVFIAIALALLVWLGEWPAVAMALAAAWLSDLLDGRLARAAGGGTRLGNWDMTVDTLVGAGLIVGLIAHGTLPDVVGFPALVVFGVLHAMGNVAASMLLQLTGYLPTLLLLWQDRPTVWWLPFAVMVLAAAIDWRRLFLINIPAFIRGITGRFEGWSLRQP